MTASTAVEKRVRELSALVSPVDRDRDAEARRRHLRLVKPPGSLGALEELSARLAAIGGRCPPPIPARPTVVVAAGDHGVRGRGVSPWPSEVTARMCGAICDEGAGVNALAKVVGAQVIVLDAGVASELLEHPRLRRAGIRAGTADLSRGPAMTREEAGRAVLAGAGLAEELCAGGTDLLVTGDMGIANTTAAACLIAAFTGRSAGEVSGRGTGIDDATFELKVEVVGGALRLHSPNPSDPLGVLGALGGLEHAALAGVILGGAASGIPVILDGVTTNAAALVAHALCPQAVDYLIAGHRSPEPGAAVALQHLG
ncbi:MAG: nicotinate-nucleotide--dimethylbenzimidazole phosphoribosyltransferase, partial [Actinomycetota bacterium]